MKALPFNLVRWKPASAAMVALLAAGSLLWAADVPTPVTAVATNKDEAAKSTNATPTKPASTKPASKAKDSAETKDGAGTKNTPSSLDYSGFRMIADRNIFNASRSSRSARSGEKPKQVVVETFSLVGTMSYAKGDLAFFDGSKGTYRKSLKAGETIAGYKVSAITAEGATLEADGKKISLKVGGQMRREDEGPWEVGSPGVSRTVASNGSRRGDGDSADSGSGEMSDALKRMLQRRQQETKEDASKEETKEETKDDNQ